MSDLKLSVMRTTWSSLLVYVGNTQLPSKQGAWVGQVPPTCIASCRTYDYEPVHVAKWRVQRSKQQTWKSSGLETRRLHKHQHYASTANQGTSTLESCSKCRPINENGCVAEILIPVLILCNGSPFWSRSWFSKCEACCSSQQLPGISQISMRDPLKMSMPNEGAKSLQFLCREHGSFK